MSKFFNYYNSLCVGANTPTVFSYDPYVTAIKEMLVSELQQIVYYIEKLKALDVNMQVYSDKVIEFISILIINLDFKKESFFVIIKDLYNNKKLLEQLYISACDKAEIKPELLLNDNEKFSTKEAILKALNEHEKNIQLKNDDVEISKTKRNLYEIIINLVLNSCNCLIELKNYGKDFPEAKNQVLKLFNTSNIPTLNDDDLIKIINDFAESNYVLMTFLYKTIVEKFGPIFEAEVPFVKKQGKAILVSGSSFLDLEKILIAVKGLNINVYTHHDMLSAFQYKKLSQYPNLVGHYQNSNTNFPLDFASFPGPIYISRNSIPKIDAIRGQIYTSAKYPSYGIAKISNDDFSPLITYALKSKGFSNDEFINKIKIGFSPEEIDKNIEKISNKFQNNEIKHIFIIGLLDHFNKSNQYINEFLTNCPENAYIISFSYFKERNNFWHVNSYYDFSILYSIVEKLKNLIKDVENDISVILTDCNSSTISHIFNLKHLKIKNIFLGPCCPNIINPVLIEGLSDLFEVKPLTKAIDDINSVLL